MSIPTLNGSVSVQNISGSPSTQKKFNFTVNSGTNRVMFFLLHNTNGGQATSVLFNGASASKILGNSDYIHYTAWRLVAPDVGTFEVEINYPSNTPSNNNGTFCVFVLDGVDQTTPVDVYDVDTMTAASMALSVTTVTRDCLLLGSSGHSTAFVSLGDDEVSLYSENVVNTRAVGSRKEAVSTGLHTMTHNYTSSALGFFAIVAARSADPSPAPGASFLPRVMVY